MSKEFEDSGGGEEMAAEPSCSRGDRIPGPAKLVLGLVILALALPILIPLVAMTGGIVIGLMGMALGLVVSLMAVAMKLVFVSLGLLFGVIKLTLLLVPWVLAVFGVLYLIDLLEKSRARED